MTRVHAGVLAPALRYNKCRVVLPTCVSCSHNCGCMRRPIRAQIKDLGDVFIGRVGVLKSARFQEPRDGREVAFNHRKLRLLATRLGRFFGSTNKLSQERDLLLRGKGGEECADEFAVIFAHEKTVFLADRFGTAVVGRYGPMNRTPQNHKAWGWPEAMCPNTRPSGAGTGHSPSIR